MVRRMVIRWPLWLMLAAAFLIQFAVPMIRVATTYKALSIGLDPDLAGILAAAFALLPLSLVLWFGRMNDRHGVKPATLIGALIVCSAVPILWLAPPSLANLLVGMAILGLGQTLHFSGLQMIVLLVSSRRHRDAILGHYMVATSLGSALGPLMIGLAGSNDPGAIAATLYAIGAIATSALSFCALLLCFALSRHRPAGVALPPIGAIIRTPGLLAILVAGSIGVTVQDLMITYLPVLGIEREIPAGTVGLMLATVALSSVLSRAAHGHLSRRLGNRNLAVLAALVAAFGLTCLALPLPAFLHFPPLALIGFGLGSAGTATLALLMVIAPRGASGTAMAMRQMGNRVGLFAMPFGVGFVALTAGTGTMFLVLAAASVGASYLAGHGRSSRQ